MLASHVPPRRGHETKAHAAEEKRIGAFPRVLAQVGPSGSTIRLLPQAAAMAAALDAPLTVLHVLDLPTRSDAPTDPVEWNIRKQEASNRVRSAVGEHDAHAAQIDVRVVEGKPVTQTCRYARELEAGMIVVDLGRDEEGSAWEIGDTARRLVDRASGSLLLVPTNAQAQQPISYRRLMVALDGSPRSESVLPLVMRLVRSTEAELMLVHVVPAAEFTESDPPDADADADDHALRKLLSLRNVRVVQRYIDRISAQLTQAGLRVRSRIVPDGDVGASLAALAKEEGVDLLILSAHGHSNRPDVACGGVAAYLMTHVKVPLLLVIGERQPNRAHMWRNAGRRPGDRPVS